MKPTASKKIYLVLQLAVALLGGLLFVGCRNQDKTEVVSELEKFSDADVKKIANEIGSDWWQTEINSNRVERGVVRLKDKQLVRFAFLSHHGAKDRESHSVFVSGKYSRSVTGGFCCEVEFENQLQPKNISEFDKLLSQYDGVSP